jgi:hypothetical protein
MSFSPKRKIAFVAWVGVSCLMSLQPMSAAESIAVSRIFPPGGQLGSKVEVVASGTFPNADLQVWSKPNGLTWTPLADPGKFEVAIAADATPGVYQIRMFDTHGASALHRFIVGTLPEETESEPNNVPEPSLAVQRLPVTINGALQARGDADVFAVQLLAGQTLVADLLANRTLLSPVDALMQLTDRNGNVLAENLDCHALDPQLVWTAVEDQLVFIRLFGFPASPDSTIGLSGAENYLYRLTLTSGPFLESASPLAASKDTELAFQPVGWNLTKDGHQLQHRIVPESNDCVLFLDGVAGNVLVPILNIPVATELSLTEKNSPPEVAVPICVTGSISRQGEVDTYIFQAEKNAVVQCQVESQALGFGLDAVMSIANADGKVIVKVDDVGSVADPLIRFVVPESGQYRLAISDVNDRADGFAIYRLTIDHEKPSFSLQSSLDLATAKIGETLELAIQIQRLGSMDQPITLRIADLPEGLAVEPVVSEGSGESAKSVTLKLIASKPFNQPITVVGSSDTIESSLALWLVAE